MTVEYRDTAVGRLPVGPAADAALAAAAETRAAADARAVLDAPPAAEMPARGRITRRLLPALAGVAAAAVAIVVWRRSTA